MGRSIFVDDETYSKLVERAKKLNIPIGRTVDIGEDGGSKNTADEGKKQEQESKDNEEEFVKKEEFDRFVESLEDRSKELLEGLDKAGVKLP